MRRNLLIGICVIIVLDVLAVSLVYLYQQNVWLKNRQTSLQTHVSNLQSTVSTLRNDKDSLENDNVELQNENENLKGEVSSLESQIEYLQEIAEGNKFEFYYACLAEQRYGVDDLQEYLDRWQWTEGAYTKGVFDCSEMSAYIEWRLENEAYHTIIVVGTAPWNPQGYHAWLLVETSVEHYMPVEATLYDVVYWSDPYFDNYFEYDRQFETIQDALDYGYEEFDWWT